MEDREKRLTNSNLPIQPIPRTLLLNGDERPIRATLQRHTHAGPLLRNGLDITELDIPLRLQFLRPDEHDAVVRQHHEHVAARQLEVGDVVFVEVFAVVERLEPELAEGFALRVGAHDAVLTDEAREPDAVQPFGVEDGRCVPDTLGDVWRAMLASVTVKGEGDLTRSEVECTDSWLGS